MALDWSKANRRRSSSGPGIEADAALARMASDPGAPQPSKAELREAAVVALASYRKPIQVLPTIIHLKCGCGHRGYVRIARGAPRKRFRCSKCGYLSM